MTDTETNDHPKWLLELENRKRKPRLAHEAGAGASCVICKDSCPGLDLHFWRKTCKNCKCSKDDHDVHDEDFPQFDLLFGSSKKYKKNPTFLRIHNRKDQAQEAFEWIPPDTTQEIATEYMKSLPMEKLPIKGSAGAALRRQLLQKQLPLHDVEYEVCDKLSDQEKKHFEKYLENIKKYVGQGAVTKILSARPFGRLLMTPANATDMQLCSLQAKHDAPPQINMVQLRTPSSFIPKTPYKKDLHAKLNIDESSLPVSTTLNNSGTIPVREKYNRIGKNCEVVKSELVNSGVYNKGVFITNSQRGNNTNNNHEDVICNEVSMGNHLKYFDSESVTLPQNLFDCPEELSRFKNPSASSSHSKSMDDDEAFIEESILADALLPHSTVNTNNIIGSTLDRKDLIFIREKLTNKYGRQGNDRSQMPCNTSSFAKDFDTGNLLRSNVTSQSINDDNENDDVKTIIAATKTKYPSAVSSLSQDNNIQSLGKNTVQSMGIGGENETKSAKSEKLESTPPPLDVMASRSNLMENSPLLIPSFQTCAQHSNANNHQAKLDNFTVPSTIVHSEKLHNHAFPCQSIVYGVGGNQPEHLEGAMENLTINTAKPQKCHKCEEVIRVGDVAVIAEKAKNAMWHPGCFVCNTCNELLVDLVYFYYKNKLYCGRDLPSLMGIPRCFACDELIFLREYTVAEGHNYHVKHFCCWDCDIPLAGKQYTTENDRPLCLPCYQKTYAKTCNMCNNVIAADQQGVALKDLNFHATGACFCCYICKKNLLQARTAIKDKKLFCSKECIGMFLQPAT